MSQHLINKGMSDQPPISRKTLNESKDRKAKELLTNAIHSMSFPAKELEVT